MVKNGVGKAFLNGKMKKKTFGSAMVKNKKIIFFGLKIN